MHPSDCPEWEYVRDSSHQSILRTECTDLLQGLRLGRIATFEAAGDSRPIHRRFFIRLVPENHSYYAGHFRGEDFRCLRYYEVAVRDDSRVGIPASRVSDAMRQLFLRLREGLCKIDLLTARMDRLVAAARLACHFLELIGRIHPYANGNGHMARFASWAIVGRFGFWPNPNRWPVEPRPCEPYVELIKEFRNGNHAPLEHFMLDMLIQGNQ